MGFSALYKYGKAHYNKLLVYSKTENRIIKYFFSLFPMIIYCNGDCQSNADNTHDIRD